MTRDLKFEVQYLLSLTLVVFGILSVDEITRSIERWVGLLVVLLLAVYFSVFNIIYAFDQSLSIKIDFLEKMNRLSKPVLLLLSAGFTYFVGHTILAVGYHNLLPGTGFTSGIWQIVIKYGGPFVPIGLMTLFLNLFVSGPIKKYRDVNIKVIPKSIRVFNTPEDTRPLTVKIENDSEERITWEVSLKIPDDIILTSEGQTYSQSFEQEGSLSHGRAFRKTFQLSHSTEDRRSDLIKIDIDFEDGSHSEEVDLQLET